MSGPEQVVEHFMNILAHVPEASFNVKLHHQGVAPQVVRNQITRMGAEVLPLLRDVAVSSRRGVGS